MEFYWRSPVCLRENKRFLLLEFVGDQTESSPVARELLVELSREATLINTVPRCNLINANQWKLSRMTDVNVKTIFNQHKQGQALSQSI
jgi:hypothetical protein